MTTIEERAKRICANTFCNQSHTPVCKTCAWRLNSEPAEPQCRVSEYKDVIKGIYESAICQLILQREELTRWRDPKKELPDNNHCVLIKITDGQQECIYLGSREGDAWMADGGYVFHSNVASVIGFDGVVIGWRPIHE